MNSNIKDNIKKAINEKQKKRMIKNGALRRSSINWIFLVRLPIKKHAAPSITDRKDDIPNTQPEGL